MVRGTSIVRDSNTTSTIHTRLTQLKNWWAKGTISHMLHGYMEKKK